MKDWVPLFQTLLWMSVVAVLAAVYHRKLAVLLDALSDRVLRGGSLKVGPIEVGELRAQLSEVRTGLHEANEKIGALFLATMSPAMFENLKKLVNDDFGPYEMSAGLERELYHLRDIGYIDVVSIKAIPRSGSNLSDHVAATPAGRDFVLLRESLAPSVRPASADRTSRVSA